MISRSLFQQNATFIAIVSISMLKYYNAIKNPSYTSSQIFIERIMKTNTADISNISKTNGIEKARITLV